MDRVAYIVSSHGFGHAARACAVMAEMHRQSSAIHFDVFSEVPKWFFSESLPDCFSYHRFDSDVGLVQRSPLVEDLEATCDLLDRNRCDDPDAVGQLAAALRRLESSVVIADISPLGLAAAAKAGIPSVLVENFTWDWVLFNYPDGPTRLRRHGRRMAQIFATANLRIQTAPVCEPSPAAESVGPVARFPRLERETVRASLGLPADEPMIVVSMGGVPWNYGDFADFDHSDGAWIVVPGGSERVAHRRGRLLMLPFHSDSYHPDLAAASDLVVSKLGYSTVAETYHAGTALAYVGRPRFPESPILAQWVKEHMVAAEIGEEALRDGAWLAAANGLLDIPRRKREKPNGAVQAAAVILERFGSEIG
jgi:UDP:flavonoid glycosyltransferase YjiC (YdhE family)